MDTRKQIDLVHRIREQENRFQAFLDNTREAIWRIDLHPPMEMTEPIDEKVKCIFHNTIIAEANDAMARMYGHSEAREIIGRPLSDFMLDSRDENVQMVVEAADINFLVKDAISHEQKANGEFGIFLNNTTPTFKNGCLVHIWGSSLEITEICSLEKELHRAHSEVSRQSKLLKQKNDALKELVTLINIEKENLKDQILHNIEHVLLPALEKIQTSKGDPRYIQQFRSDLENMTSAFGRTLINTGDKLTPREVEISRFVKNGLRNKEIAEMLNISVRTVEKHRRTIRRKLGLNNKRINLQTHLASM